MPIEPTVKPLVDVINEHLSKFVNEKTPNNPRTDALLRASVVALAACYASAKAGNVTCREAVKEIEKILLPTDKKREEGA